MSRTKIEARCVIDKLKVCYIQPQHLFEELVNRSGVNESEDNYVDCGNFLLKLIDKVGKDGHYTQLDFAVIIPADSYCKLGTFIFTNSGKYDGLCFFTFENLALYSVFSRTTQSNNYQGLLFYIADTLGLTYNNITQVDIALDTTKNYIRHLRSYIHDFKRFEMFLNGKIVKDENATLENYGEYYSRSRLSMSRQPTLYFGQSKDIGLKMRVYNKSVELIEQSKQKAERYSEFVAFTTDSPIYRVEVVIKNNDIKAFHAIWKEQFGADDAENILALLMNEKFNSAMWKWATDRLVYFRDKTTKGNIYLSDIL